MRRQKMLTIGLTEELLGLPTKKTWSTNFSIGNYEEGILMNSMREENGGTSSMSRKRRSLMDNALSSRPKNNKRHFGTVYNKRYTCLLRPH